MSCLICNELLHHHIIICGLISCVSHINTISPPKLSLNYQNQTMTFQAPVAHRYKGEVGPGFVVRGSLRSQPPHRSPNANPIQRGALPVTESTTDTGNTSPTSAPPPRSFTDLMAPPMNNGGTNTSASATPAPTDGLLLFPSLLLFLIDDV